MPQKTPFDAHCPPPDPHPRKPRVGIPKGATDCHAHVIGPAWRYPFVANRSYTPPDALLADYRYMLGRLGLTRAVLVQPSMHGNDNTVMLRAIAETSDVEMRAVVVVPPDIKESRLAELHKIGARGVRINLIYSGGNIDLDAAAQIAARIRDFGWHIQILVDVSLVPDLMPELARLPVPLVFDHFGHMPADRGVMDKGFLALLEMIKRGNSWVKISGAYRVSSKTFPYPDVRLLYDALVEANPDRLVWGTDWPHTVTPNMPNDGDLIDLVCDWLGEQTLIEKILVDNPARLYRFDINRSTPRSRQDRS